MPDDGLPLEQLLPLYAEVTVKIGLNLQPGQRLLILGPVANGGASLDAAPLVRHVAATAYAAGAPLVEVLWGDEPLQAVRFKCARRDTFKQFSAWLPGALVAHVEAGHAVLSIYANDPDQLKNEPPELVSMLQQTTARAVRPFREHLSRNQTNSVAAWEAHLNELYTRTEQLNRKRYTALRYSAPGTELTIGLPDGHLWIGGRSSSAAGIAFAPNVPTEEVFTMPHKDRVDGTVRSTKPLSYGGTLIDGFSLRFAGGRVVDVRAKQGEAVLRTLIETDPGAARLGEVALVPQSSPIAQTGLLFYNTLFDENAASHVAIGAAYKFTLQRGEAMSDDEFERAGGNRSATHVDFMIGSADLDIDGVLGDGRVEPLMRRGDWALAGH